MYISEETAQLILDAIAWSNEDWEECIDWEHNTIATVEQARMDFLRFCRARGIEGIEGVGQVVRKA